MTEKGEEEGKRRVAVAGNGRERISIDRKADRQRETARSEETGDNGRRSRRTR